MFSPVEYNVLINCTNASMHLMFFHTTYIVAIAKWFNTHLTIPRSRVRGLPLLLLLAREKRGGGRGDK
jgi:hypothetical protein